MKKLFLLLVTTFSLIGCTADDETINDYIGTWSGTFTGSDKGVWNFVVADNGNVTGTTETGPMQCLDLQEAVPGLVKKINNFYNLNRKNL